MPPSNQGRRIAISAGRRTRDRRRKPVGTVRYRDDHGTQRPMTGVDDTRTTIGRSSAGRLPGPLRPYADIFRVPGAWRFSAAGVIGRMPMSMFGLGTVLLISAGTGRYGLAGSVSAAGALGNAVCGPQLARLVDRVGQHRVLVPVCIVFSLSVAGLVAAVQVHAPDWTLFVCGIAGGAAMPQTGPMARAR